MQRSEIAAHVAQRLEAERERLQVQWKQAHPVPHAWIDDLLPEDVAAALPAKFPSPDELMLRSSLRERKRVGVDVQKYDPLVGDVLYAFQDPVVIEQVAEITSLVGLRGDPSLYAAGLSVMGQGDFLNPHVDNSHDGDQQLYRAINVLYYVSPDWGLTRGGNLELWDRQVKEAVTVESKFNRLVIMATNATSWHSVSKVVAHEPRLCVSNYYFSATPPGGRAYRHVTTFTGRPEEKMKRAVLKVTDAIGLNLIGKVLPALTKRTKHRIQTKA